MEDFAQKDSSYNVTYGPPENTPMVHKLKNKADNFKDFLSSKCCTCLSSVPSFALVILAVVLVMLLIATIPLAFAFTYITPKLPNEPKTNIIPLRNHFEFPNSNKIDTNSIFKPISFFPRKLTTCKGFGFACTDDPNHVIGTYRRCDGYEDCNDGSDEMDCHECNTFLSCKKDKRLICLRPLDICNNINDCDDKIDETLYCKDECSINQFKCSNQSICIPDNLKCDGLLNCESGEDEVNCTKCNGGAKFCKPLSSCIQKRNICNGDNDCPDGSDEMDCNCKECSGNGKVLCDGEKKMCISRSKVCDGFSNCPNGEDELDCFGACSNDQDTNSSIYNKSFPNKKIVKCEGKAIDWRYACDGSRIECDSECDSCYLQNAFDCYMKSSLKNKAMRRCIPRNKICDGHKDCFDGSDELECDCSSSSLQFICKSITNETRCIKNDQKCDGFRDCPEGDDEKNCNECANESFHCVVDKTCIDNRKRCDGHLDCEDESDEMNCSCEECTLHPFKMYMCSSGNRCFRYNEVCSPHSLCATGSNDSSHCAVKIIGAELLL